MSYWYGMMNWPLKTGWRCQTCGTPGAGWLEWGIVHGVCRCAKCHTQYTMRDDKSRQVSEPICLLKPEFVEPAKEAWKALGKPLDELTEEEWAAYGG